MRRVNFATFCPRNCLVHSAQHWRSRLLGADEGEPCEVEVGDMQTKDNRCYVKVHLERKHVIKASMRSRVGVKTIHCREIA